MIGLCRFSLTKKKKKKAAEEEIRTPILTQDVESMLAGWEERARGLPPEA